MGERGHNLVRTALLLLVLWTPLPFGSVQPGSVLLIQIASALACLIALAGTRPEDLRQWMTGWRLPAACCAGVLLVGGLQLLPAPGAWSTLLAEPTSRARELVAPFIGDAGGARALSLAPLSTWDAMLRFAAYVAAGLAAAVVFRSARARLALAVAIASIGAFQAAYGAAEYLSGHQHIFGYAKRFYQDEASGTFINRNHFAAYLTLTLPFCLALAVEGLQRLRPSLGFRERIAEFGKAPSLLLVGGVVATALGFMGVVLSYSRGGLLGALAGLLVFVLLEQRRRRTGRFALALTLTALLIPTLWIGAHEVRAPGERFVQGASSLESGGRLTVWKETARISADYPVLGSGLGTFAEVFPLYRPATLEKRWGNAHNDWLQLLAEGGPPALGAMLLLLAVTLRRLLRRKDPITSAMCAALVAITLQALFEFPLRMPAIALLTAMIAGAAYAVAPLPRIDTREAGRRPGTAPVQPLSRFSPRQTST
ncbi:hypothetical protein ABI59_06150 [Acidobacteria bacterium Mor1]|nr:hypothetical protein ABI59_06150 [Acidobacteria bacterium Mor1]